MWDFAWEADSENYKVLRIEQATSKVNLYHFQYTSLPGAGLFIVTMGGRRLGFSFKQTCRSGLE